MSSIVSPNRFYVYLFRRNDIPFYIGKGCGTRIQQHFDCVRKNSTCKHLTCRVIRKELREGGEITSEKIAEGIPEQAAFDLEKLFISLGAVYKWPLVNQTRGGEGVSGWERTPEWRKQKSESTSKLMQDPVRRNMLATINASRIVPLEEREKQRIAVTQTWSDPELIEQQRQRGLQRFSDPEERRKQKERYADPKLRAKCGAANKGMPRHAKTYAGFVSPDGVIYEQVQNLDKFSQEHNLLKSNMCLVAQGKQAFHRGWTRYPPLEYRTYKGTGFVSPSGEIFADIPHLTNFCKLHGLQQTTMSEVTAGTRRSHKGWTRYEGNSPIQQTLF